MSEGPIGLLPGPEQEMLGDTVRRFVRDRSPSSAVRKVIDGPADHDPEVWRVLASGLGLTGLGVPEHLDGSGGGPGELVAAFTELGAALVPSPLLACALATTALVDAPEARATLSGIAAGERIATVAFTERTVAGGDWIPPVPATAVSRRDGVVRLTGRKTHVLSGATADVVLVLAMDGDRPALCVVDTDAPGVETTVANCTDLTRSMARVGFADAPAQVLDVDVDATLRRVRTIANLLLSAEQCGALAACVAMVSGYARVRVAFGRPIGSFQAVKHRIADMYSSWELSRAALRDAVRVADDEHRFALASATARALVSPAYLAAAGEVIQLHGGIGYTWEHDAHLYYRNALSSHSLCGDAEFQRELIADLMDL